MNRRTLLRTPLLLAGLAAGSALAPGRSGAAGRPVRIVMLGDSLTAGLGLPARDAIPAQLQARLKAEGHDIVIVNAGVSGDTVADGLARLDWALGDGADAVIVALGANDMLRGRDPAQTRKDLDALLGRLAERRLPVLVCGMLAGRNLGPAYAAAFDSVFPDLAAKYGAALYPFLLDGVALDPKLNQPDGVHPNRDGAAKIAAALVGPVVALAARVP
jgi:acyl-CoA thioesterase-1